MDSNAADQRPRVPLLWRGAYVCGAFIHVLASFFLVDIAYELFGVPGAAWAVGVVFLSWLAFIFISDHVMFGHMLPLRRRPEIAAAGAGGGVAGDGDGDDGMDAGAISALPAAFTFQRDVQAAEGWAQCSICLDLVREGESVRRLPACGHLFHAGCVDEWLRAHATCPLCRAAVRATGPRSERLLPV